MKFRNLLSKTINDYVWPIIVDFVVFKTGFVMNSQALSRLVEWVSEASNEEG